MKNNIMYYYNLRIDNITQNNNNYYFTINNDNYCFTIYTRDIKESNEIYKLNKYMLSSNILVHEIIPNKDNYVVTIINNIPYILYKIYINKNKKLTINELTYLSNYTYQVDKILTRNNWNVLWSTKIDYFEYQINQMGKKYPILVDTFAYFTGLAENAISYVKYTTLETQIETSDNPVISHRKINNTIEPLYNPLNIILDHKSRDIAEYIKLSFLNKNTNIYQELDSYFSSNYYSEYGLRLLYARIIYPSFYFDMYEQIIQGLRKESDLLNIVSLLDDYELYLKEMYYYLKKYHNIPEIDWITKK